MALSEWDRNYIEHLIRRDVATEAALDADCWAHQFAGADPYFWDMRNWPVHPHHQGHSVVRIKCPDDKCGQVLEFSINKGPWLGGTSDHVRGCEFFHTEQRQWVDDWADSRDGRPPVVRHLTWTEKLLAGALLQDRDAPDRYRMIVSTTRDGELIRRVA